MRRLLRQHGAARPRRHALPHAEDQDDSARPPEQRARGGRHDWVRQVAPIEASWLGEVAPHFWKNGDVEKTLGGQGRKMPKGQGAVGRS
jgi:hypothetical protein